MHNGRAQLAAWITRRFTKLHGKQSLAAKLLDLDQSYVSQLLSGRRSPSLMTAVRIERLTGIPVEAWLPQAYGGLAEADPGLTPNALVGKE